MVKGASTGKLVLILPVKGQKVKGISPSLLEVNLGSREEEPARTTDRATIAAGFRHDLNT